ncbi:MAG: hypothetical protein R3C45_04700 [Phycisphaerales bacterium]
MAEHNQRVVLDGIDWRATFPFLRLFNAFGMAIQPGRLMLSLMLVLLLYLGGTAMDFAWGASVRANELSAYARYDAQAYSNWLENTAGQPRDGYIFKTLVEQQVGAFERLVVSATALDFGLTDLLSGKGADSGGVIGALASMVVRTPGWLYSTHPWFMVVFLLYAFALTSLIGAAVCRVAAIDACLNKHTSAFAGLKFALEHWVQIMLAPLIPLGVIVVIRLVLALAGLVFFSAPVLDVIGAAIFILFLLLGFIAAMLLIGLALGGNLLIPGITVEGTDAFDAVSRAYNYVVGRPWRYFFYTAVMIVYGAVTYLLVGLVVFSTIWFTRHCLSLGAVGEVADGVTRLDAVMPEPQWGRLLVDPDWDQLGGTGTVAAALVMVWIKLLIAVLPAFAVSYYFNAQTWVYLLLRRSADLVDFDDVYIEPDPETTDTPAGDKLEPTESAAL